MTPLFSRRVSLAVLLLLGSTVESRSQEVTKLPVNVHAALELLFQCSKRQDVHSYGRDQFNYCGVLVRWPPIPDRVAQLQDCLARGSIARTERLPSFRKKGAIAYEVMLGCSDNTALTIDVESVGNWVWIAEVDEAFGEPVQLTKTR